MERRGRRRECDAKIGTYGYIRCPISADTSTEDAFENNDNDLTTAERSEAKNRSLLLRPQSPDRSVMHSKRPRYISQCFTRLSSRNRLALLMSVQLEGSPHMSSLPCTAANRPRSRMGSCSPW
jgi:hypothetical protein